ncbi:GL26586 [Drosophila persimilis]|uniref:Metalloendopeptidase n=1 Tax=Drosophila persimilis TaxID=7234 RepID=B4GSR6_DROPE|nr:seminal metalloprotease 1 [Drosophila persimilis]EDW25425.1 GL26586 [Drosophila persimilis]
MHGPLILSLVLLLSRSIRGASVERLETDPELTGGYIEGDMVPDGAQRNIWRNETYRWPNRIVYYHINSYIDQEHRNQIVRAIQKIESVSCLTFREASTDQKYYVNVTSEEGGCYSYIGHLDRVQQLNLQPYEVGTGCFRLYTIVHEFLHALGFFHQQSAANRDEYVRIVEENITEGMEFNFDKYSAEMVNDFDAEYDYGSVMHYGPLAFSKNNESTIVPLQEGMQEVIGQRLQLSQTDIDKLNAMYRCPK